VFWCVLAVLLQGVDHCQEVLQVRGWQRLAHLREPSLGHNPTRRLLLLLVHVDIIGRFFLLLLKVVIE
jgi:hypothetical protein